MMFRVHLCRRNDKAQTDAGAKATADLLNSLTLRSQTLLDDHPINLKRAAAGKDKANSIWLWSPGYKTQYETSPKCVI